MVLAVSDERAADRGAKMGRGVGHEGAGSPLREAELPDVCYVSDLARFLRISEKAVRARVSRGLLPAPFKLARNLAWSRASVIQWVRDCYRSGRPDSMQIKLRPYAQDKSRFHVDIRFMHPCPPHQEVRRRCVAPPGLDERQARAWGERKLPELLRELLAGEDGGHAVVVAEPERKVPPARAEARTITLAEFYRARFEPEYVQLQKHSTQVSYDANYRNHIEPMLGDLPLAEVDESALSTFTAKLRAKLDAATVNLVLAKVAKVLRFARRVKLITEVPEVSRLPTPRRRRKPVYDDAAVERLLRAARAEGPEGELICLLALDAGLRVSEICGLEWADLDLEAGLITVQNSTYRGEKQTPKGTIATLALSSALKAALVEHRQGGVRGPLVLYRRSKHTAWEWAPHTPHSVGHTLEVIQTRAGVTRSGPHLLRHSGLTRLAELGASVYVVQAVARHSRLQTTESYLHMQGAKLTREAAVLLDRASDSARQRDGKSLAKLANPVANGRSGRNSAKT